METFENHTFTNGEHLRNTAKQIYDMFVEEGSELEINIDHRIRAPILDQINSYDQTCFSEAKEEMVKLMEPIFLKFRTSQVFSQMRKDLGENCIVYPKSARNAAVKILLRNLDKTLPKEGNNPIIQQRHDLIRCIMHEFCRKRLKIDFCDRDKPGPQEMPPVRAKKNLLLIQSLLNNEGNESDEDLSMRK